jgi:O-succinylbenzoic acid--CoA ligase
VIPWDDASTQTVLNPRLPAADRERVGLLVSGAGHLPGHVWLTTSGATGRLKPVALAKQALLASAEAVNAHLGATAGDVWLNPLPPFHVGGLAIHARATLSGAGVVPVEPWDGDRYVGTATAAGATLSSLVPTQVFDLVRAGLRAPATLRAVVVGGGALATELYHRARALGWPLLPSYGATECGSQAATADLASLDPGGDPALRILPHLIIRDAADGRLEMRGASLFTGYATERGLEDPKDHGWWRTDDRGTVTGGWVTVTGRADDVVKVVGEPVSLSALERTLESVRLELGTAGDAALCALPDQRTGWALRLAYAGMEASTAARLVAVFNDRVAPYERLTGVIAVERVPRTELGKVVRERLLEVVKRER